MKAYVVVEFIEEKTVAVVLSSWINRLEDEVLIFVLTFKHDTCMPNAIQYIIFQLEDNLISVIFQR